MDRHIPRPGERYLHFKGKQYQVLCVATHSETREQMVVYQALYGEFTCYVRPLWMFMSEVDRAKYPDALQKYRFEEIPAQKETGRRAVAAASSRQRSMEDTRIQQKGMAQDAKIRMQEGREEAEEEQADPALLQFLDADTLEQKYQVLKMLEGSVTNRLIDDFAVALDLVIPEGSVDQRYFQLLNSVRTMQRFENNRFR